ncbi:mycothiol transferase [Solicola sp. PLA-1-18]|uniref:mycothiol transferase n=1 Tax=Solicola sp. PLA-1-18 TaxID=3380532 RepID=UPI003B7DF71E
MSDVLSQVFTDQVERIDGLVEGLTDGLSDEVAFWRPDPAANSVSWLLWHLSRVQDDHVAGLAGTEQVWTSQGFASRAGLPFGDSEIGYGQDSDEVGAVRLGGAFLREYHRAVHAATLEYVGRLDDAEVDRVVDADWDPPVTAGVRLVSLIGDCLQHAGQAAYVVGLAERR